MDRRRFVSTLALSLIGAPLADGAQQAGKVDRIGFVSGTTGPDLVEALRQGLRELGWTEGQNFVLEYRSAESRFEKVPELAAALVRRNADVIVASATAMPYLRQGTANVPVVFGVADDPVSVARHDEARELRPAPPSRGWRRLWRFALSFGDTAPVGVAFNDDDLRMVDEPIDQGGGDRRVRKDRRPVTEGQIRR
jgi:hypothetical protein